MPRLPYREIAAWLLAAGAVTCTFVLRQRRIERDVYVASLERDLSTLRPRALGCADEDALADAGANFEDRCAVLSAALADGKASMASGGSSLGSARVIVPEGEGDLVVVAWPHDPIAPVTVTCGASTVTSATQDASGRMRVLHLAQGKGDAGAREVKITFGDNEAGAPLTIALPSAP